MKFLSIPLLLLFFIVQSYAKTTHIEDLLSHYQPVEKIDLLNNEVAFWKKKVASSPNQQTYKVQLASAYSALFATTANIEDLKSAEVFLTEVRNHQTTTPANILRALAHNYISQHRFCEAMNLVIEAYDLGSDRRASELMLFDLYEELGDDEAQKSILQQLSKKQDFNYLIRLAKWQDAQGRLDLTIALMKEAEAIAESSKQTARTSWIYTNLADYYGHAGEINVSKKYYLKALSLNPADWYSMKGLAWITYSDENNPENASAILKHIAPYSSDPGIKLLQAEIMEFSKLKKEAKSAYEKIAREVSQPEYGNMYNAFLCEYYLSQPKKLKKAMTVAQREITVRATPHAYDLLAQVYYTRGDIDEAKKLSKKHIWNHTFEPHILKNQLQYFKDSTDPFIEKITKDMVRTRYELGPLEYQKIFGRSS